MHKAQRSLFVFGLYMVFVVDLGFMLIPMFILNLFGLSAGDDVWIRFVGMLASIIGVYSILVVRAKLDHYFMDGCYALLRRCFHGADGCVGQDWPKFIAVCRYYAGAATWTWFAVRSAK
jgi:hypothetical protein